MLIVFVLACTTAPEPPAEVPRQAPTTWVERSDAELEAEVKAACTRAVERGAPVLLEFSAPWCVDCKAVAKMKPQLAPELRHWESVTAHVGRFDRHTDWLRAFEVGGIVHWAALKPTDCDAAPATWPRLRSGLLEPASGQGGPRTPADLAAWLREAREG